MKFFKDMGFIVLVALVFTGITAGVRGMLISKIRLNDETRNTRYLLDVMGIPFPRSADPAEIQALERRRVQKRSVDGMEVYRSITEDGETMGYAFPIGGKGFWGPMRGFVALDADLDTIRGIVFTSHNETPGLGARVEEKWFRDQFKGLKLSNATGKDRFVEIGKGRGGVENRVDAITGATMTSQAVERFLNADLGKIVALKDRIRRTGWQSPQER